MIDREDQHWLWTGESADCVNCDHHIEYHWTLDNGSGFCTHCATNDDNKFYHEFVIMPSASTARQMWRD